MEEQIQYELDEIQRYALMMRTKNGDDNKERIRWLDKIKTSIERLEAILIE
jgi:hypothetical protein